MLKKSEPPLWAEVKQSKYLFFFIVGIHFLAIVSTITIAIIALLKLLLILFVCCSLYVHLQRYRQGLYLFTLRHTAEFAWELVDKNCLCTIRILNSSVLTSFVIILHIEIDQKHRSILVCCDAVSQEDYRKLLVALKITALD